MVFPRVDFFLKRSNYSGIQTGYSARPSMLRLGSALSVSGYKPELDEGKLRSPFTLSLSLA
jgi:hypothetical protein